jgi:peptidyl-prolyl cis-trans isomerase SurA
MRKLVFLIGVLPTLAWGAVVERVAAVVNNEVIALSQIYEIGSDFIAEETGLDASPSSRRSAELKVLEELIAQELMVQEMSRLGIDVTSTEVDQALDDIASRNGVERGQLKSEVERTGLAWSAYRESITQELRGMKFNQVVLQPRVSLNEDEIANLYKTKASTLEGGRVLDGIFLAWTESVTAAAPESFVERLAEARAGLATGKTWSDLVAAFPESPYASLEGRMSAYQKGELVESLEAVAWSLPLGDVSAPVVTDGGVFLLRYAEVAPSQMPDLEQMRSQLQMELMAGKIESEKELWLVQARRRASVEIKLEAP